jgi:hypothetical membrane protein
MTQTIAAARVTRTLLAFGVVAGPLYVLVSVTEALTRDGFDPARHAWSLLSNGDLGWIHITNLVVTGLLTVAFAVGLRRALRPGLGGTWAPRLVGVYGASVVGAGVFRADPAMGFPPGTPDGAADVTWHGTLHFVSGGIGFLCLVVACLVVARRFAAEGRRGWARFSRATGVLFLAGFAAVAAGAGAAGTNLAFTAAVVLAWSWVSALAAHLSRR